MRIRQLLTAIIIGLIATCPDAGSAMDAKEMMRRVERQNSAADEVVQVEMTLINASGRRHVRTATLYQKQKNDVDDMRLIRFHTPPDMAKNGGLTI